MLLIHEPFISNTYFTESRIKTGRNTSSGDIDIEKDIISFGGKNPQIATV
jgi:hypothetical protein